MIRTLGELFPQIMVMILNPIPIMAVVLVLLSKQPRENGAAFALGWLLGFAGLGLLALSLLLLLPPQSEATIIHALVDLALAGLLFWLALRSWRKRPRPGQTVDLPKWMIAIDNFTPFASFRNGALLAALNPKHIALTFSAVETIAQSELVRRQHSIALLCYTLLGSLSVLLPVLYYLIDGQRAKPMLDSWKDWLGANNALVMTLLLLVIGALIFGRGLGGLFG